MLDSIDRTRPLCPDHRDKQAGSECLACRIDGLRRHLRMISEHATKELPEHQAPLGNRLQVIMLLVDKGLAEDEWMRIHGREA